MEEKKPEGKKNGSLFRLLVNCALAASLVLSVVTGIVYMKGAELPDEKLFFLLSALRCFSGLTCIFSLFSLFYAIKSLAKKPSAIRAVLALLYFVSFCFGASLIAFNAFMLALSGGNV
jgi:hypothetical protein